MVQATSFIDRTFEKTGVKVLGEVGSSFCDQWQCGLDDFLVLWRDMKLVGLEHFFRRRNIRFVGGASTGERTNHSSRFLRAGFRRDGFVLQELLLLAVSNAEGVGRHQKDCAHGGHRPDRRVKVRKIERRGGEHDLLCFCCFNIVGTQR